MFSQLSGYKQHMNISWQLIFPLSLFSFCPMVLHFNIPKQLSPCWQKLQYLQNSCWKYLGESESHLGWIWAKWCEFIWGCRCISFWQPWKQVAENVLKNPLEAFEEKNVVFSYTITLANEPNDKTNLLIIDSAKPPIIHPVPVV